MSNNDSINASNDAKIGIEALLLSNKPTLRQKQLEAYGLMVHGTAVGRECYPGNDRIKAQIAAWNSIDIFYRKNPKLISVVIAGHNYYEPGVASSMGINTLITRLGVLKKMLDISMGDKEGTNLLTYIGKNAQMIVDCYIYDKHLLLERINSKEYHWNEVLVTQDFNITADDKRQEIVNLHPEIINVCRWFLRVQNRRQRNKIAISRLTHTVPLGQRFNNMISNIVQIRPHNWSRSLNSNSIAIATRLRPPGECLGIELEFVASKGSDIVSWDHSEYPVHPWLFFKGDGSIRANQSNETLANYQELTWFINGNSNMDWKNMQNVLSAMTGSGAGVNNSCGNHVHIDMRHRTAVSAARTANKVRDAINTWAHRAVSFTRAHNTYCGIDRDHHNNRYTAVNTECISEHQTIEVRLGMPTLNFYKLKYWCAFMQYLAKPYTSVSTLEDFMQSDAPVDLKHYVFKRILKFQDTYTKAGVAELPNFANYQIAMNSLEGGVE
jgi:hypothetical protein